MGVLFEVLLFFIRDFYKSFMLKLEYNILEESSICLIGDISLNLSGVEMPSYENTILFFFEELVLWGTV